MRIPRVKNLLYGFLLSCLLLGTLAEAAAESPIVERNDEFLISKWTTEQGLPQSTVTSIIQSSDGYIWIGTFGGLARFDGIKFTVFDSANSPNFTDNRVLSVFEDSRKLIWIGTETGELYLMKDGEIQARRPERIGSRGIIYAIVEDKDGRILVASDSGVERFGVDAAGMVIPGAYKILTDRWATRLTRDPAGNVWAGIERQPYRVDEEGIVSASSLGYVLPKTVETFRFLEDGRMLAGNGIFVGNYDLGSFEEVLEFDKDKRGPDFTIARAKGTSWLQQSNFLYEIQDGSITRHDLSGVVANGSRAIMFDREDNIWLATQTDGLVRLTRRKIKLAGEIIGHHVQNIYSVTEDRDGAIWLGGNELYRIDPNGTSREFKKVEGAKFTPAFRSSAVGPDGTLWVGGTGGLFRVIGDRIVAFPGVLPETHIHSLFFDREGDLWIGSRDGLDRLRDGNIIRFTTADGLADNGVHFITQIRDGSIMIGTIHGLSIYRDGRFSTINQSNGLSGSYVRDVCETDDGTIWIATYGGGLTRYRNGDLRSVTKANGLPNNFISRILTDNYGRFWLLNNLGIFAVKVEDLNAVADGATSNLIGAVFGVADGMKSSEANGGHQPAGIRASDGRLWFPMIVDVVIIDPSMTDRTPPQIIIEGASQPGTRVSIPISRSNDAAPAVDLQKGERSVEVNYTGISFAKPNAIRFFYKLEGIDEEWTDAGARRTAFYPYLPSGSYKFQVKAVSGDGVESVGTADLTINVPAEFWETTWFRIALICAFGFVAYLIYKSRTNQLKRREANQREFSRQLIEAHETERERMAAELHDGLGQNLLLIKNWSTMAKEGSGNGDASDEYLDKISQLAADSIGEARTIVGNLSPKNLRRFGITASIENVLGEVEESTGIRFENSIENIDHVFDPEAEKSIYRIVQECVSNVVRHSESPRAEVSIRRLANGVEIIVSDHGVGFDVKEKRELPKGSGGFGLRSIDERIRLLGGTMTIDSDADVGTRITIRINV